MIRDLIREWLWGLPKAAAKVLLLLYVVAVVGPQLTACQAQRDGVPYPEISRRLQTHYGLSWGEARTTVWNCGEVPDGTE